MYGNILIKPATMVIVGLVLSSTELVNIPKIITISPASLVFNIDLIELTFRCDEAEIYGRASQKKSSSSTRCVNEHDDKPRHIPT